jgi:hypothetical protein
MNKRERKALRDIYLKAAEKIASKDNPLCGDGCCLVILSVDWGCYSWRIDFNPVELFTLWFKPEKASSLFWMTTEEDRAEGFNSPSRNLDNRRITALLLMAEIVMTEDLS